MCVAVSSVAGLCAVAVIGTWSIWWVGLLMGGFVGFISDGLIGKLLDTMHLFPKRRKVAILQGIVAAVVGPGILVIGSSLLSVVADVGGGGDSATSSRRLAPSQHRLPPLPGKYPGKPKLAPHIEYALARKAEADATLNYWLAAVVKRENTILNAYTAAQSEDMTMDEAAITVISVLDAEASGVRQLAVANVDPELVAMVTKHVETYARFVSDSRQVKRYFAPTRADWLETAPGYEQKRMQQLLNNAPVRIRNSMKRLEKAEQRSAELQEEIVQMSRRLHARHKLDFPLPKQFDLQDE